MMMKGPLAPAMPARNAAPYPRSATRITHAPCSSAIRIEPSVEPLSATTTSPHSPAAWNAFMALSTQYASEFASFIQGMTTDTSTACDMPVRAASTPSEVITSPIEPPSYHALSHISPSYLPATLASSDSLPGRYWVSFWHARYAESWSKRNY